MKDYSLSNSPTEIVDANVLVSKVDGSPDLKTRRNFVQICTGVFIGLNSVMIQRLFAAICGAPGEFRRSSWETFRPISDDTPIRRNCTPRSRPALQVSNIANKHLSLSLNNLTCEVNSTGGEVLSMCDGNRSVDAIATTLAERYEESAKSIGQDCLQYLESLRRLGIIIC